MPKQLALDIFDARKPEKTMEKKVRSIAFWLFPLTALWGLFQKGMNHALGNWLLRMIVPAMSNEEAIKKRLKEDAQFYWDVFEKNLDKWPIEIQPLQIRLDNTVLDGKEIRPELKPGEKLNDRMHIIYLQGNAAIYESCLYEMRDDALALGANVIGYNYPDVVDSKGDAESTDHLVKGGIAQVARLLKRGVEPKKIILKGTSLGGGIAARVALHYHNRGVKLGVSPFVDRSFSILDEEAAGLIRTGAAFDEPGVETPNRRLLSKLSYPFISFALEATKLQIDTLSAFREIEEDNKEYIVVRSSREDRRRGVKDDEIIDYPDSLHSGLRRDRKKQKRAAADAHGKVPEEVKARYKARKMTCVDPISKAHNADLTDLRNRYGMTGQEFFWQFVRKIEAQGNQVPTPSKPLKL